MFPALIIRFAIVLCLSQQAAAQPADFECAWRKAAVDFARAIQPGLPKQTEAALKAALYDTFGSPLNCPDSSGARPSDLPLHYSRGSPELPQHGEFYFVAPTGAPECTESGNGGQKDPYCKLETGIAKCRASKHQTCSVLLQSGIHRLTETIYLSDADSGLTISSAPNQEAIVSGAVSIDQNSWKLHSPPSSSHTCESYPATDVTWGHDLPGSGFKSSSATECMHACKRAGCTCAGGVFSTDAGGLCFLKSQAQPLRVGQSPATTAFVCSACNANVWVTTLPEKTYPLEILSLFWDNYSRGIRARYPNAEPELDLSPVGYIDTADYLPPPKYSNEGTQVVIADNRTTRSDFDLMFTNYTVGVGGDRCAQFTPPVSYWCSRSSQWNDVGMFRVPSGLNAKGKLPNAQKYRDISQALVTVWHPGSWATWMFKVDRMERNGPTFHWTKGGFQGGRGAEVGGLWNVQNVFEELDYRKEWFFNESTRQLFVAVDKLIEGPPSTIEVSGLKSLFHIEGSSPERPAVNIVLRDLSLVRTAYTFMDPDYSVPSGGDWALGSSGVVYLENTESVTVANVLATQLDGNAIMIRGYNSQPVIRNSTFSLIGGSAVAMWGKTTSGGGRFAHVLPPGTGPDGTQRTFVVGARIESNVMERLGVVAEKQVACTFQAKTANVTIRRNLCFRNPRAGFLVNDGFYGGHVFEQNLLVNNVMETDDHGPINFWDRQSFFWNADGSYGTTSAETSTVPFRTKIRQNFMVANYGANGGCIDSDDGTSYHDVVGNACLLGGFKSDNFQGHSKRYVGNLNIFPNVYGPSCAWLYPGPLAGYPRPYWPAAVELEETYANNTCVVGENFNYVYFPSDCDFAAPHSIRFRLGNNTIISPDNSTIVQGCNGKQLSVQEWLKLGTDKGSIVREFSPTSDELVAMVKALPNF